MGHLKIINFPFVPNGKLNILRCHKFWAYYSLIVMCLNIGTLNNHHTSFGTNEQVVVLGVPKLRHFRVVCSRFETGGSKPYQMTHKLSLIKGHNISAKNSNALHTICLKS